MGVSFSHTRIARLFTRSPGVANSADAVAASQTVSTPSCPTSAAARSTFDSFHGAGSSGFLLPYMSQPFLSITDSSYMSSGVLKNRPLPPPVPKTAATCGSIAARRACCVSGRVMTLGTCRWIPSLKTPAAVAALGLGFSRT